MWVFIKGIPEEMDSKALERFIKRLLFPGWLPFVMNGRVKIAGSKILKIVHVRSHSVEHHGLIHVLPSTQVERVIRRINLAKLGDQPLQSHRYSKRFTLLDRRGMAYHEAAQRSERRQMERRRNHLVSHVVDASM